MWDFGAAAATVVALLVPVAPPQAPVVPAPPRPDHGCVVPVDTTLELCPRDELRPPVLCVVPVTRFEPPALEPVCPEPVPDPRGRIVPLTP